MEKKPTKLAICGKVVSIEKIGEKSLAQFRSQLKNAGVVADETYIAHVYEQCGGRDAKKETK